MTSKATVNVYRDNGVWCYAAWIDDEFDCSDTIGIENHATDDEARIAAADLFIQRFEIVSVRRVDDAEKRA